MTDKTNLNDEFRSEYDETLLKTALAKNMLSSPLLAQTLFALTRMLPLLFRMKKPLMKRYDLY